MCPACLWIYIHNTVKPFPHLHEYVDECLSPRIWYQYVTVPIVVWNIETTVSLLEYDASMCFRTTKLVYALALLWRCEEIQAVGRAKGRLVQSIKLYALQVFRAHIFHGLVGVVLVLVEFHTKVKLTDVS